MDTNLYTELVATPFDGQIPISVLDKFPNFSVYLKLSIPAKFNAQSGEVCVIGMWVSVGQNKTMDTGEMQKAAFVTLHCLQKHHSDEHPYPLITPTAIPLKGGMTLEEFVFREKLLPNSKYKVVGSDEYKGMQIDLDTMKRDLNVVLYLCSTNLDVVDISPTVKRHPFKVLFSAKKKGKFKILPAIKSKIFTLGASLSKALKEQESICSKSETAPIRPHVRRAHWHGYWTGPRTGQQDYILKWIPPTLIGTHNGYMDNVMLG